MMMAAHTRLACDVRSCGAMKEASGFEIGLGEGLGLALAIREREVIGLGAQHRLGRNLAYDLLRADIDNPIDDFMRGRVDQY
jgi:hypothetical protein